MRDFSRFEMVGLSRVRLMGVMDWLNKNDKIFDERESTHNEELLHSIESLAQAKRALNLTDEQYGMLIWDAAEIITVHKIDNDDFEGLNIDKTEI
jgi:hypothetical protein